jgi:hypothetical protein
MRFSKRLEKEFPKLRFGKFAVSYAAAMSMGPALLCCSYLASFFAIISTIDLPTTRLLKILIQALSMICLSNRLLGPGCFLRENGVVT